MEELFANIEKINNWIDSVPDISSFQSNNDFMTFSVELMSKSLYLMRVCSSLSPDEVSANRGLIKRRGVIVGHIVRMTKLYEGLIIHIAKRQTELAELFTRPINETIIRAMYLMQSKNKSLHQYILSSYKPEKEMIVDLENKAKQRPLIQIEKRMRRKIKEKLRNDGISIKELMANRQWNLDGKDFRQIMKELGCDSVYAYSFGCSSHHVHGDWYNISTSHLKKVGRYYTPNLSWSDPDPRLAVPLTIICLNMIVNYLNWSKTDPDELILPTIIRLQDLALVLDNAHESTLSS